jgi:hypothetical protein
VIAVVAVAGFVALVVQTWLFGRQHRRWTDERTRLINIAIARHAGEVVALNRAPKAEGERHTPFLVEGIT